MKKITDYTHTELQECFNKMFKVVQNYSDAVEATAVELEITNKDVIECIDYEDYVGLLVELNIIPDIDHFDFLEKHFYKEYLEASGPVD